MRLTDPRSDRHNVVKVSSDTDRLGPQANRRGLGDDGVGDGTNRKTVLSVDHDHEDGL